MSRTFFPRLPNASAKFQQIVDFPTPPLLLNTDINFAKPFVQTSEGIISQEGKAAVILKISPSTIKIVAKSHQPQI